MTPTDIIKPAASHAELQFKIAARRHAVGLLMSVIVFKKRRQVTDEEKQIIEDFVTLFINLN